MIRLLLALLLVPLAAAAEPPRFAGYHETWAEAATTDPDATRLARLPGGLDLVMLAFARPDLAYAGGLDLRGTGLGFPFAGAVARDAVAALRLRSPRTKVLLSVGGATYPNWPALDVAAVARLVRDLGLDGVDVDFEPPDPACRLSAGRIRCASDARFIAIVEAFRLALPRPALLTVALWSVGAYGEGAWRDARPGSPYTGMALALLRSPAAREIDLVSIMAYDAGPRYDPAEAFGAYRAVFPGPLLLGVSVQGSALPPSQRLAQVEGLARRAAREGGGMMLYSLQMASPHDRRGAPFVAAMAGAICRGLRSC
ncbi:glycosyl hydrolase family 18 protein [Falsiroseomonas sp. E2-1-a20]|uniref:glycosyl hydrolase family 18 protein n=1 Tax=Falsiroseomonas sp. E2-1-a20 TaxID=3239300 RepID=UPI003F2DCAAF